MTPHFRLFLWILTSAFLAAALAVLHRSPAEGCAVFSTMQLVYGLLWLFSDDGIDSASRGSIFGAVGVTVFVLLLCGAVLLHFTPEARDGAAWLVTAAAVAGLLVEGLSVWAMRAGQQLGDDMGRLAGRTPARRSGDTDLREAG